MSVLMIFPETKAMISLGIKLRTVLLLLLFISCNPHAPNKKITPLVIGNASYSVLSEGILSQNRWWEALNDPVLDALIEEALSANLDLKQIHARIEQTIAAEKQAGSFIFPQLSAETSERKDWESDNKTESTYNSSLLLSWEIDLWGRISSARKAATHDIIATREELEAAALLLSASVAETYFQILEQNLQILLLEHQIHAVETFLELI